MVCMLQGSKVYFKRQQRDVEGRRDQGGGKPLQWLPRPLPPSCSCLNSEQWTVPTINHCHCHLPSSSNIAILNQSFPNITNYCQSVVSCSCLPSPNHKPFQSIASVHHIALISQWRHIIFNHLDQICRHGDACCSQPPDQFQTVQNTTYHVPIGSVINLYSLLIK